MYFNDVKSFVDFRFIEDTTLDVLKIKLDNLLYHTDKRKVVKIEYNFPSIDNEEKIWFSKVKLKTNEDMWTTYHRYETKGSIEMDVTIVSSIDNII